MQPQKDQRVAADPSKPKAQVTGYLLKQAYKEDSFVGDTSKSSNQYGRRKADWMSRQDETYSKNRYSGRGRANQFETASYPATGEE